MYKIILDKEHTQILKESLISFCKIRQNDWYDYVNDLDVFNTKEELILLFEKAYEIASPDYKEIYKIIKEGDDVVNIEGFEINDIYIKVFKDDMKFSLKELKRLLYVVEEFMRMRMGQFLDFVDDVSENGWVYDSNDPDNDIKFEEYINRRNEAHDAFDRAYANAYFKKRCTKSEKVLIAEDMYDVFKHQIWIDTPSMHKYFSVYSNPPMLWSKYEKPKIEKVKE